MSNRSSQIVFWILNVLLVTIVGYGAAIFDSYRYERSGLQALGFSFICIPGSLAVGIALCFAADRIGYSPLLLVTPVGAIVVFSSAELLPVRLGFWITVALVVAHLLLTVFEVRRHRSQAK